MERVQHMVGTQGEAIMIRDRDAERALKTFHSTDFY